MTREEALKLLNIQLYGSPEQLDKYGAYEHSRALKMAIKALEQESCEDAISRQAVLALAKEECETAIIPYRRFVKDINALPPVNLQPKTGYWIKEKSLYGWDGKSYQCSECGRSIHLDLEVESLNDYPYCHCGAKMVDPQESEGKG